MKLIQTIVKTNIFLAFAAVFLTVSAQIQLGLKPQYQPYFLLIFLATFFEYNKISLFKPIFNYSVTGSKLNVCSCANTIKPNFLAFLLVAGIFLTATVIEPRVLVMFILLGVLTLLYSSPFTGKNGFNLREIPYLKIFLIVSVWSVSTVLLPVIQADEEILSTKVLLVFTERFFYIFSIAIQFDIRDMQTDQQAGLKTIPILINKNNSLVLSYFSLFLSLLISVFHYQMYNEWYVTGALSISIITTYLFMKINIQGIWRKYYYLVLDGTLALQGLLVVGFYLLNQNN